VRGQLEYRQQPSAGVGGYPPVGYPPGPAGWAPPPGFVPGQPGGYPPGGFPPPAVGWLPSVPPGWVPAGQLPPGYPPGPARRSGGWIVVAVLVSLAMLIGIGWAIGAGTDNRPSPAPAAPAPDQGGQLGGLTPQPDPATRPSLLPAPDPTPDPTQGPMPASDPVAPPAVDPGPPVATVPEYSPPLRGVPAPVRWDPKLTNDDAKVLQRQVGKFLVDVNILRGPNHEGYCGTGIVLTSDGEVITNNHVINGATQITVTVPERGQTYRAALVGHDPTHDVAVLQLAGAANLTTAEIGDPNAMRVGNQVAIVGNAQCLGGRPTVSTGPITTLNYTEPVHYEDGTSVTLTGLIKSNSGLLPGDSGGATTNAAGQVIALNVAYGWLRGTHNPDGTSQSIPIDTALAIARSISPPRTSQ
jgi:Trypsin-like peptidase domain